LFGQDGLLGGRAAGGDVLFLAPTKAGACNRVRLGVSRRERKGQLIRRGSAVDEIGLRDHKLQVFAVARMGLLTERILPRPFLALSVMGLALSYALRRLASICRKEVILPQSEELASFRCFEENYQLPARPYVSWPKEMRQ